jgi:hypothetical protein
MRVSARPRFVLHGEPSDEVVRQLVSGWLEVDPRFGSNLPESVRVVLENSRFGRAI